MSKSSTYQMETSQNSTLSFLHIKSLTTEKVVVRKFLSKTKYLLVFFFIFTALTVLSIVETEIEQDVTASPSALLHNTSTVKIVIEQNRNVASVDKKNEMVHINILCPAVEKVQKLSTQQMVMFSLSLCQEVKSAESVSMTNITNGFKAQIFKMNSKNYRTDFIQLSRGNNILLIESVLKDGQKRVQTLEILSGS